MAGEKLLQVVRQAGKPDPGELTDLVYGEVTSVDPLKIKVDQRFEVEAEFLILSVLCTEVSWWRGLLVGDIVRMLRVAGGQRFYVIEREGGLTVL